MPMLQWMKQNAQSMKFCKVREAIMKWKYSAGSMAFFIAFSMISTADAQEMSKGAYLARAGDCAACHTAPGGQSYAGGYPLSSPIGVIYSTNITPDKETGIGNYSLRDFSNAVRAGKRKDGVQLYPAMPYPSFAKITDDDLKSLYDYFMHEVKSVKSVTPKNKTSPVVRARWPLSVWNNIYGSNTRFEEDSSKSEAWNRGSYLVQGLAHCGACHTPRGIGLAEKSMDEKSDYYLTGARLDGWYAPSLRIGGTLSPFELEAELKKGANSRHSVSGPMRDVVANSMQYLSNKDIKAIATYIISLPTETRPLSRKMRAAARYNNYCSTCHGMDGKGISNVIPSLVSNETVIAPDDSNLIQVVFFGEETATTHKQMGYQMPSYGDVLSRQDIADVLSYIRQSWGNNSSSVYTRKIDRISASSEGKY